MRALTSVALLASIPAARGESCQNQFTIDACNAACSATGDVCGFLCGATRTACEVACDVVFDTCEFGCNACDVGCDVCCATTCFPGTCGDCRDGCNDCHNGCSGARGPCKNLCQLDCGNCVLDCEAGCPDCKAFRKIGESCIPLIDDCAAGLICWPAAFSDSSAFQCFPGEALDLSDDAVCRAMYSRDLHDDARGANAALSFGAGASASVVGTGSVEVGTVYDPDGCFGCYTQTCLGAESNVEVNAFAAVGQYESFDVFPGEGLVEIGSAGVAVVSLTVGQVISTEGQVVGATEALAFGPSLVPITLGLYFCNTAVDIVGCLDADDNLVEVVNNPPTARCTDLATRLDLEADAADLDIDDGSFDPDGDAITHEQSPPGPYEPGEWLVTLTVTDSGGLSDSCSATVTVDASGPRVLCGAGVGCTPGAPALGLILLSLGGMRCRFGFRERSNPRGQSSRFRGKQMRFDRGRRGRSGMNRILGMGAAFAICRVVANAGSVAPGQPAPSLTDVRWIQGDPVSSFETGRIYVIEFWSTWCGACVESIDRLNELARLHAADATFIAIHIWQHESSPRPAAFLEDRSKSGKPIMKFAVAEDVNDATAKAWMDATASSGFPTAMILDRAARLVWFGHAAELENPLKEVIEGTLDVARSSADMERRIRVGKLANASDKAIDDKDYETGIRLILEALDADPRTVSAWIPSTYGHLLAAGASREMAAKFVNSVLSTDEGKQAEPLAGLALAILHFRPKELRDLDLALKLALRASAADKDRDPHILVLVAKLRAELGEMDKAVQELEVAMQSASNEEVREVISKALTDLGSR